MQGDRWSQTQVLWYKEMLIHMYEVIVILVTVNQLNLTALKFIILQMETYLVQENLAFFKSFLMFSIWRAYVA